MEDNKELQFFKEIYDKMNFILEGMAKAYPVLIPFATFLYSLLNETTLGFFLGAISILSALINSVFKAISKYIYLKKYPEMENIHCDSFWLRPNANAPFVKARKLPSKLKEGASCGVFNECSQKSKSMNISAISSHDCLENLGIGMPSGHSQIATTMTFLFLMLIWGGKKKKLVYRILSTVAIVGFGILTMTSRVVIGCHSILQVLIGSFIGYLLGIGFYYFLNWMYPNELVKLDTWWKHTAVYGYPFLLLIAIIVIMLI